ncbi:MAG: hypothetical protein LHW59_05365 [Candidatus Cloacimonetes bacterium]|nr:hypothetical protein [Candidatus Cloacimonadota bacterium]
MLGIYLSGVVLVWVISFLSNRYFYTEFELWYVALVSTVSYVGLIAILIITLIEYYAHTPQGKYRRWFESGGK